MKTLGICRITLFLCILFPFLCHGIDTGPPIEEDDSQETFASIVTIEGTNLSIDAKQDSLANVLDDLGRAAGISIAKPESFGDVLISEQFKNLPLKTGIQRILKDHSYVLEFSENVSGQKAKRGHRIATLRVLGKKGGDSGETTLADRKTPTAADNKRKPHKDSEEISESDTLWELAEQFESSDNDPTARDKLVGALDEALHEGDSNAREAALDVITDMENKAPEQLLTDVALTDADPENRTRALEILSETNTEAALQPLRDALNDTDSDVRSTARDLLEELEDEKSK